jgi:tetratricopeptide (TPR) repeat protein
MYLPEKRPIFLKNRHATNPYRALFWAVLVLFFLFILRGYAQGEVKPLFMPSPTPTRTSNSFALEAEVQFAAGNLDAAISAYRQGTEVDPANVEMWANLARIQTYSTTLLTTDTERDARFAEAMASANEAVAVDAESSSAHAVLAFVMDWYATSGTLDATSAADMLSEAEQEAVMAIQLDTQNTMALVFYAEILVDELQLAQAEQYISQALERAPDMMDVHRVNAYLLESQMDYNGAIQEYQRALEITPNLTFLLLRLGANYRQLAQNETSTAAQTSLYENALTYFAEAAQINEQLGVLDPVPYVSIARTYSQMGEFYAASLNMMQALQFNPNSPDLYGQLGIVYFKARNYEGSIPALRCAVSGCDATVSCEVRQCDEEVDPAITITGMPLSSNTVVYYYTLGSALAGMHGPANPNFCEEAMVVLAQVREAFPTDTIIMGIVTPSENICIGYGFSRP